MGLSGLLFGIVLATGSAETKESSTPYVALDCGAVVDTKSAKRLGPQTIVVRGDRIDRIEAGIVEADANRRIDLTDATCMPGWVDLHAHLSFETASALGEAPYRLSNAEEALRATAYVKRTLMSGFTTVRDPGGAIAIYLRNAISQGWIEGPRIFAAGAMIASTGGHADPTNGLSEEWLKVFGYPGAEQGVIDSPDDARKAVRSRMKSGSDWIKITMTGGVVASTNSLDDVQMTQAEVDAIVATARDYGIPVAAHAHGKEGIRRAVLAGVDTIEHGTYADQEIFDLMRKHGTVLVPTLSAGAFLREHANSFPEPTRSKAKRAGEDMPKTFAASYRAGVQFAFGSDPFVHGENAREFELMVEAGVPPLEAIRAATWTAAHVLRNTKDFGTIELGKIADIVAVAGDPESNISIMRHPKFIMKGGVIVLSP